MMKEKYSFHYQFLLSYTFLPSLWLVIDGSPLMYHRSSILLQIYASEKHVLSGLWNKAKYLIPVFTPLSLNS